MGRLTIRAIHPRFGECIKLVKGGNICIMDEEIEKLAHYEDMEEQGRLIEVIRCKDCANCGEDTMFNVLYCQRDGYEVEPEHYCGFAKLKELEE
jgi:hypothetical protein